MNLRWLAHLTTAALHAVNAFRVGETFVDERWRAVIAEPGEMLIREIRMRGLPESRFWRNLLAFSSQFDHKRHLVKMALLRTYGQAPSNDETVAAIGGAILDLERAVGEAFPNVVEETTLRGRVLREQWEARGPGMLAAMRRILGDDAIAPGADVVFVPPVLGGGGAAQLLNNTVRIEAVLTNPVPEIPEAVRLAWMLAQLNLDVPIFGENIQADRLPYVAAFALVPIALHAAAEVEFMADDPALIGKALDAWLIYGPPDVDAAELTASWYLEFRAGESSLAVALQALDRMFG